MAITVFADVVLPNAIVAAGVRGKNIRANSRVQMDSGQEAINIVWTQTLRQFEVGIVPLRVDQWQQLETLHEITEGGAYGFLMEDPKDNNATHGIIKSENGILQMYKRYIEPVSGRTKDRKITRPRASTIVFSGGSGTVNELNGHVTGVTTSTTWTGKFYVPVHFLDDFIDWELVVSGAYDTRFAAGPNVVLQEIRE